ncbi:MAG TPA: methyltransferase dimerization domain-containing protein, partial [Candidatus Hydrogenedentes bacterium]|nr:methyltransferase dimerization domain-containing protein [Candidatus Hydrogenedentota bacterium]
MDTLEQHRLWSGEISAIANAFKKSQILFTAFESGIFELLEHPVSAQEIATALNWSERGATMLLGGLLSLDLITLSDGKY